MAVYATDKGYARRSAAKIRKILQQAFNCSSDYPPVVKYLHNCIAYVLVVSEDFASEPEDSYRGDRIAAVIVEQASELAGDVLKVSGMTPDEYESAMRLLKMAKSEREISWTAASLAGVLNCIDELDLDK